MKDGWYTCFPRSGDVIHPQLWESGSGYETNLISLLFNTIYIWKTKGSIVIVISPLIALMKDQVRLFNQKGIRVHGVRML